MAAKGLVNKRKDAGNTYDHAMKKGLKLGLVRPYVPSVIVERVSPPPAYLSKYEETAAVIDKQYGTKERPNVRPVAPSADSFCTVSFINGNPSEIRLAVYDRVWWTDTDDLAHVRETNIPSGYFSYITEVLKQFLTPANMQQGRSSEVYEASLKSYFLLFTDTKVAAKNNKLELRIPEYLSENNGDTLLEDFNRGILVARKAASLRRS